MRNAGRLANKVALISGGATGIGQAIAVRFAGEGATVVIADINESQGQATAGMVRGHFLRCDITDPEQVRAAVSSVEELYGGTR